MDNFQSTSIESSLNEDNFEFNKLNRNLKNISLKSDIDSQEKSFLTENSNKKHFEDFNLEEIYDFISELNKTASLDSNTIFKKNKNIFASNDNNINNNNLNDLYVCKELSKLFNRKSAFKSFKSPQKVSLIGKVVINGKN